MKRILLTLLGLAMALGVLATLLPSRQAAAPAQVQLKARLAKVGKPSVDHGRFEALKKTFAKPQDVTAACLSCHNGRHTEVMASSHWAWERTEYVAGKGLRSVGKKNVLNNFCIGIAGNEQSCNKCHVGYGWGEAGFDFKNPLNIDCLACHDTSHTYQKANGGAGMPEASVDLAKVAQSVGGPQRSNCLACHGFGGGGNNVKHGDLEKALMQPNRQLDVHMAVEGANLQCTACHVTDKHQMAGKMYSISSMNRHRSSCEQCHGETPHGDATLDQHTLKVACQTCHIPTYAKEAPTKLTWDWSTAGRLKDGQPYEEKGPDGTTTYTSLKGSFTWGRDVKPEYAWFNGTASHHLLGDSVTPGQTVKLNELQGSYADPGSKIIPVKVHRAVQPFDPVHRILVQPKTVSTREGDGGYWKAFDWTRAGEEGMKRLGLPFSGRVDFIATEMTWPLNHMVAPKAQTVGCVECHTRTGGRLAKVGGFYLPGRDRHGFLDGIGRLLVMGTLLGVAGHGLLRVLTARRRPAVTHVTGTLREVQVYTGFQRFWHWAQAVLIGLLLATGFEIHGSWTFFGYAGAVRLHNGSALAFLVLIAFAVFWHLTTGQWRQYLPTGQNLRAQAAFYLVGIFRNAPHPTRKTQLSRLNPLQRLVYLGLKVLVIPVLAFSGLLYLFYRYPQASQIVGLRMEGLRAVALVHTFAAFLVVAFLVAHIYLITTGHTLTSNLKAMLTGREALEEEGPASEPVDRSIAGGEGTQDPGAVSPVLPAPPAPMPSPASDRKEGSHA